MRETLVFGSGAFAGVGEVFGLWGVWNHDIGLMCVGGALTIFGLLGWYFRKNVYG